MSLTPMSPTSLRLIAVGLVLGSGGLMILTGALVEAGSWGAASIISILGGAAVQAGLLTARRAGGSPAAAKPGPGERRAGATAVAVAGLVLAAGALMVATGYAAAKGDWYLCPLLVTLGGATILAAGLVDRRSRL